MEFMHPSKAKAISTYRVMDQYGEIIDKEVGVETSDEEALSLYKNMVKRQWNGYFGLGFEADMAQ